MSVGIEISNLSMANGTTTALDDDNVTLESYTVALSITMHLLSTIFGGGSSVAVIAAVLSRKNIDKQSYTTALALFFACCTLNAVWGPVEVTDMLVYHYWQRHPCDNFAAAKTAVYLFLVIIISIIIAIISLEGIARAVNYSWRPPLGRLCHLFSCIIAVIISSLLVTIFIIKCATTPDSAQNTYVITEADITITFQVLIAVMFCLCAFITIWLIILLLKEHLYWENCRPHIRQKKVKLVIPEFLISQSNPCGAVGESEECVDNSRTGTPSPSSPKLLTITATENPCTQNEADDSFPVRELPKPSPKSTGSRLGVNMSAVLGRRRHTICQITDMKPAKTAPAPSDPMSKAKGYNYVRKFSVDISALQAQLQNPKIYKEPPFLSDLDLSKKDGSKDKSDKPLLPLKPLPKFKFDESKDNSKIPESKPVVIPDFKILPPPMILVSNDGSQNGSGEIHVVNCGQDLKESPLQNDVKKNGKDVIDDGVSALPMSPGNHNSCGAAKKPAHLELKDSTAPDEADMTAPTLDSMVSEASDSESEGRRLARLMLLLCVVFCLSMLPLIVTELVRSSLSLQAYINIHTCVLAVSALQTIVYPHLVACSDQVVNKALRRLKWRLWLSCGCRVHENAQSPTEDSSNAS